MAENRIDRPADGGPFEMRARMGRRTFMRRGGVALLAVPSLPALLAACGSADETGDTDEATLERGGLATGGLANVFLDLDPHTATTIGTIAINDLVYEGLFTVDEDDRTRVVPELATSGISDKSATEFEITLRDGVTFHDGSPLTAQDVAFSFSRFSDPDLGIGILFGFLTFIDKVEATDDQTVRFKLKHATPLIEERLALVKIVSESAIKRLGKKHNTQPVGSGPYKVTRTVANNRVELERFAGYSGEQNPALDEITLRVLLDGDARTSALQSGQVHAIEDVPYENLEQVAGSSQLNGKAVPAFAHSQMLFNCGKAPFDDVRVRQAVMWAIDRDVITDSVYFGHAKPAVSHLPEDHPGFVRPETVYTRDPERARQLLAEAGQENLEIELMISNADWVRPQGTIIEQQLQEIGIKAALKPGETEALYTHVVDGSFDCYLALGDASIFAYDAHFLLSWLFTGTVAEALAHWNTPEKEQVTKLLDEALRTGDDAKRKELYGQVQNIAAEQVPAYPLHHRDMATGWSDDLVGFEPRALPGVDLVGVGLS